MFKNDLEVIGIATDDKGKSFTTDRNTVNLNMKPDTANRVRATGFRVIQSLDLQPGRYLLRVGRARREHAQGRHRSTYDLEVPDFTKAPLTMSGVALTSAMSGAAPTVRPKDPLEKLLPGPLTTYREFPQIDEIALFAEIYDNVKQAAQDGDCRHGEGRGRADGVRDPRGARQLGAGGLGGRLRLPGARAAEGDGAGSLRASRRGHRARRRSADGVARDGVPRLAGAGGTAMNALAAGDGADVAALQRPSAHGDDRPRQP